MTRTKQHIRIKDSSWSYGDQTYCGRPGGGRLHDPGSISYREADHRNYESPGLCRKCADLARKDGI